MNYSYEVEAFIECITDQNGNSKRCFVLSFVTGEQQKKVPKKSARVVSVMIESLQAGCAGPPWLCARLQPSAPSIRGRLLEAYGSRARTPGALGCGCMIGQPAADNTTRHRCQGRRGSPLCTRRGTDISIAMKKAFFFAYFLLSPNKRKYEEA